MKITKQKNKIVIEIPFYTKRDNPWTEGYVGKHKTLIGIIRNDECGNQEIGFAMVIDMDYKGKADQETDIIIYTDHLEKPDFIKLCKDLELDYIEYPICAYCHQTIYGCYMVGDKGDMCLDCKNKNKK